jgi:hypothetical protein
MCACGMYFYVQLNPMQEKQTIKRTDYQWKHALHKPHCNGISCILLKRKIYIRWRKACLCRRKKFRLVHAKNNSKFPVLEGGKRSKEAFWKDLIHVVPIF